MAKSMEEGTMEKLPENYLLPVAKKLAEQFAGDAN